ncbi:MAG: hypothetical protein WAN86_12605 [Hyphomicrobiaceae bacterium]
MKISDFRAGLSDLQNALRRWGATKQAGEIDGLSVALEEFDDLTVAELARRVKAINTKPRTTKVPKPLDVAAVERHLAALNDAAHTSEAFEAAVDRVVADTKQLPAPELKELARRFGGSVPAKTSRPAIGAFLRSRRLDMRRQDGIGATIDRMLRRA